MKFQHTVIFTMPRKGFRIKTLKDAQLFLKSFWGSEDFELEIPDVECPDKVLYLVRRKGQFYFGYFAFKSNAAIKSDKELANRVFAARESINVIFK